jgi:hypothetical protein
MAQQTPPSIIASPSAPPSSSIADVASRDPKSAPDRGRGGPKGPGPLTRARGAGDRSALEHLGFETFSGLRYISTESGKQRDVPAGVVVDDIPDADADRWIKSSTIRVIYGARSEAPAIFKGGLPGSEG